MDYVEQFSGKRLSYLPRFPRNRGNQAHWNVFNDIPWERLDPAKVTDLTVRAIEIYCAEEMYVPDYSAEGLRMLRSDFGMARFHTCWASEEARHGLVFREYLTRSDLRSDAQFAALEKAVFSRTWTLPFKSRRQMACYGALQEGVTYTAYKSQKDRARESENEVLEAIFHYVGCDEAAHAGFYRAILKLELEQDREGTVADLAVVLANFKMPGDALIPDYRKRLNSSGGGISARAFVETAVSPILVTLQIARSELKPRVWDRELAQRLVYSSHPARCQDRTKVKQAISPLHAFHLRKNKG